LVIKWFLPCLTSIHLFTWLESYCFRIRMNTLGWVLTLLCAPPRLQWILFEYFWDSSTLILLATPLIYILSHRSTLYWLVDMFFSYRNFTLYYFMDTIRSCHGGMYPDCKFDVHTLSYYFHEYTMYWSMTMLWVIWFQAQVFLPQGWYIYIVWCLFTTSAMFSYSSSISLIFF